jgi:hypothetical protein
MEKKVRKLREQTRYLKISHKLPFIEVECVTPTQLRDGTAA